MRCNKAQHAYLRDRHLLTYADVVAWTGTSWRWHLPELPPDLSEGIRRLTLPVSASVPLLPGQAWHMADSTQLFSNRLTEILTVSTYSTPQGFRSDIVYRHWQLPHPVLSPTLRTVVTKTSSPQLYHGPTDIDSWFPVVFGSFSMSSLRASRVLLVTSTGRPYCSGLPPPPLSSIDTLPDAVEVYRILPSPPPSHLGRLSSSGPPLYLDGFSPGPF